MAGCDRKHPRQMEPRQAARLGDVAEGERIGKMAFDVPERLLDRVHAVSHETATVMPQAGLPHLIGIAAARKKLI